MSMSEITQTPVTLGSGRKRDVRTQFGALCWRMHKGRLKVALVTSRHSKRWILPKGWPVNGATPAAAAAREAYEEAGLEGTVRDICLGVYSYQKRRKGAAALPCVVAIFPMEVTKRHTNWPEAHERILTWVTPCEAADLVDSPELAQILLNFAAQEALVQHTG
ncbi:MAG: NUDIX hydrolase [Pseudomonadota bacterium]